MFAGQPDPTTVDPPAGYLQAAQANGNTAYLLAFPNGGPATYTLYFYSTDDVTTGGKSVQETVGCL